MESRTVSSVLRVLSFFEIFHCPLTRSEIFNYLLNDNSAEGGGFSVDAANVTAISATAVNENADTVIQERVAVDDFVIPGQPQGEPGISFTTVSEILDTLLKQGIITEDNGLYFLSSADQSVSALERRLKYQGNFYLKIKRARRWARFMSVFPGVRAIAAVNSVGFKLPSKNADIDFLIITDKKSLYLSRLLITIFLKIFGLRPTKQNQKDKICTSFWLSEMNLNLEKIAYSNNDVYLYYWLLHVYPLYEFSDEWERWQSANFWLKKKLPNSYFSNNINKIRLSWWGKFWKSVGECLFNHQIFNVLAKKIQFKYLSEEIKALMNRDTRVIVNDEMLKFHTVDNRQKYFEIYNQYLKDSLNQYQYVAKEN